MVEKNPKTPDPSLLRAFKRLAGVFLCTALPWLFLASEAFARRRASNIAGGATIDFSDSIAGNPLILVLVMGALSLLPFLLIMITSFVKIAVVLSIVRSALGTQQNPPTQVITGLSIILTVYVMVPVGLEIQDQVSDLIKKDSTPQKLLSTTSVKTLLEGAYRAKEPIKKFLMRHSHKKDREMFYSLAYQLRQEKHRASLSPEDLSVIVPSFVISELKEAFQIGFLIFLPFIVVDMVVANILLALGMHMLSPTTISLPFKLLLFVLVDGWYLIIKGLILGYV